MIVRRYQFGYVTHEFTSRQQLEDHLNGPFPGRYPLYIDSILRWFDSPSTEFNRPGWDGYLESWAKEDSSRADR